MTYKFKLSSRLALLRSAALLVGLSSTACLDSDMASLSPLDRVGAAKPLTHIIGTVSPSSAIVASRQPVRFNTQLPGAWFASAGAISADGQFSANAPGAYKVIREGNGRSDTVHVKVLGSGPSRDVAVSPLAVQILTGGRADFTASTSVRWSATGGTIDDLGTYTAGNTPGSYVVVASGKSGADTARVTVNQATVRRIVQMFVAPAAATVLAGGVQRYSASARYEDGAIESVAAAFAATGAGTINSAGEFTASGSPGSYGITASGPGGIQGTASGSVVSAMSAPTPVQSPTASVPHEPTDFRPVYQLNPSAPTNPLIGANYGNAVQSNLSVAANKFRVTFPTGLEQGYSSISPFDMVERLYPATTPAYSSWYLRVKVTFVGTDWISQNVTTKMLYLLYGTRTQNNTGILAIRGPQDGRNDRPQTEFMPVIVFSRDLNGGSITLTPNVPGQVGAKLITVGVEHTIEVKGVMGSPDRFDAEIYMWVDGVKVMDYSPTSPYPYPECYPSNAWQHPLCQSRVMLRGTSDGPFTDGFYGIHFDPVWGGYGGSPQYRTRTDYLDFSEIYLSVPR